MVIACLGSSTVAGKGQAYDWIADLRSRPANAQLRFLNFGVGGDLAYNTLQRLPAVIARRPDRAVILVGGDDVLASTFPNLLRLLRIWKGLRRDPSPDWFEDCLRRMVHQLQSGGCARVGLCSLGPIGEDPASRDPSQEKLNRLVAEYSAIVERVAVEEHLGYLPFYERIHARLVARPGPAFTSFGLWSFYRDAFKVLALRRSLDRLGEESGWRFHTDGVHLNAHAGKILADLVQGFIR